MKPSDPWITGERAKIVWIAVGLVILALVGSQLLATGALLGQSSEGDIAASNFEEARENRSPAINCREAGEVAAAYLRDGDDLNFNRWKEREGVACLNAQICVETIGGC